MIPFTTTVPSTQRWSTEFGTPSTLYYYPANQKKKKGGDYNWQVKNSNLQSNPKNSYNAILRKPTWE